MNQYFNFNILSGSNRFGRLGDIVEKYSDNEIFHCSLDGLNTSLITVGKYVKKIRCNKCELRQECKAPVNPSIGRYNIMIVGEAPGRTEDEVGIGFVGSAGKDILWPRLGVYGITPEMVHLTNVVKCYPQITKTPTKDQIGVCGTHLTNEITNLKPIIILAFGNTGVKFFREEDGGITKLNGTTEWSDRFECWICWCIHPASVLYQRSKNKELFEDGISNFVEKVDIVGGNYLRKMESSKVDFQCKFSVSFLENNRFVQCETCEIWEACANAASRFDWKLK
jgi:uracil-DNA glycosylase